jgi:hypothetical protein
MYDMATLRAGGSHDLDDAVPKLNFKTA